jgi:hypothetical protein
MNLEEIVAAIGDLSLEDFDRLKQRLESIEWERRQNRPKPRTVEEWMAEFRRISDEFRGDSSEEEMKEIVEAMTLKSKPSDKGL